MRVRFLLALAAVAALSLAAPATAQVPAPPLPPRVTAIVQELHRQNIDLARGDDEQRRELTKKIAEQIVFEFPGHGYGWKSAGPGRPPSKDCFARVVGAEMWCWDWQNGGSREPMIPFHANYITGQVFIPLSGVDHLGASSPPPDAPGPTPPQPLPGELTHEELAAGLRGLVQAIAALEARIVVLTDRVDGVAATSLSAAQLAADIKAIVSVGAGVPAVLPPYKGDFWGITIISKPCPACVK